MGGGPYSKDPSALMRAVRYPLTLAGLTRARMCTMEREDAALRVAPASGVGMAALGSATETRARQAQLRATEPIGRHGQVPEGVAFLGVKRVGAQTLHL